MFPHDVYSLLAIFLACVRDTCAAVLRTRTGYCTRTAHENCARELGAPNKHKNHPSISTCIYMTNDPPLGDRREDENTNIQNMSEFTYAHQIRKLIYKTTLEK